MKTKTVSQPLTNTSFLNAVSNSFLEFLRSGTSRSNKKLKPLHGAIAEDIVTRLGDRYSVMSQGYGNDREGTVDGRYFSKKVDITIKKDDNPICGISVKFVMQNYSQNSVNYFENMLGETANVRSGKCLYFQIFIILDKLPYYKSNGDFSKWETFTGHNAEKYAVLSKDDTNVSYHTPVKTLLFVVHIPEYEGISNSSEYRNYYKNLDFDMSLSEHKYEDFDRAVILNDYEKFRDKLYYAILAL